jgi:hypothetical protein
MLKKKEIERWLEDEDGDDDEKVIKLNIKLLLYNLRNIPLDKTERIIPKTKNNNKTQFSFILSRLSP